VIRDRQLVVIKNNSVYFFTTVCPNGLHAKYDRVFAQTLASVRWKAAP